jgi:hypothetical protein
MKKEVFTILEVIEKPWALPMGAYLTKIVVDIDGKRKKTIEKRLPEFDKHLYVVGYSWES